MKKVSSSIFVVFFVLVAASICFAGPWKGWRGSGGWGVNSQYHKFFDPKTIETISGEVVSAEKFVPFKGMSYGVVLTIKTDKETLQAHFGPVWYVERLDVKLEKGDKLEIKGSKTTFLGKPVIIVSEFKKGDAVFVLRDSNGYPIWAGWRR